MQKHLGSRCKASRTAFGGGRPAPCRLRVSCPAVEQDLEAPSTSGRGVLADGYIHSLFAGAPGPSPEPVEGAPPLEPPEPVNIMGARIKSAETLPQLLELIRAEGPSFRPRDTSAALHQLAVLHRLVFTRLRAPALHHGGRDGGAAAARGEIVAPAAAALSALVVRQAEGLDAWGVSLALWSYGVLDYRDEAALGALCRRGGAALRGFAPIDIASALVGWARLRARTRPQREFVDQLLAHALDSLSAAPGDWRPQELANAAWALSKIGAAGPGRRALLDTLMDVVQWRLEDFNVQELTTLVYAYARMHYRIPSALNRISNKISHHLDLLSPQDAANMMWGFARLAFKPGRQLLDRLPVAVAGRLHEFKPQELCNLLYGYGVLRHHHPLLMDAAAASAAPRLAEFSTQDIVLTLWSLGAVRHAPADAALLDAAAAALLARRKKLLPLQIAVALKAFAKVGHQPPAGLIAELGAAALEKLPAFKPVELCHLMWAYAHLGYRDVRLVEAVVAHVVGLLQGPGPPLPKITVDTIVWAAQRVGFWPQMLIDTAEMRGVYVKYAGNGNGGSVDGGDAEGGREEGGGGGGGGGAGSPHASLDLPQQQQQQQQQDDGGGGGGPGLEGGGGGRPQLELTPLEAPPGGGGAAAAAAAQQRRPPPKALSLHQWRQAAQVAQHQSRQQEHKAGGGGDGGDGEGAAGGAWGPDARVAQLLGSVDYGDDAVLPLPATPNPPPVSR
ncbi:MAG: hypothetical protein J3K34DRAFT_473484 [Monoraphidium minutum]|nr:MAG: hypothetical protein J3K34DRAFT_473484 [Monoraphidium minutum]